MSLECPKCQSTKIMDHGRQYPVYPMGCLYVIGLPIAMFHQGQTPHLLECEACGARFKRRTLLAKVNLAFLALFGGFLVIAALYAIFGGSPD